MQKIVFNPHYLMYVDTAITDYWRALALPYESALALLGGDLFVKTATVNYHASARFDDQLDMGLRCVRLGRSSLEFEAMLFRGEQALVSATVIYVFANPHTQTSQAIPDALRELISDHDAGKPVTTLQLGDWPSLQADAAPLRYNVFVQEQSVPEDMEWDEYDAVSTHAVIYNRLGQALATGRLLPSQQHVSKLGRMAVVAAVRGAGLGEQLFEALRNCARLRGDHTLSLHAQRTAIPFYQRLGLNTVGEPFVEAGIPHVHMQCSLI